MIPSASCLAYPINPAAGDPILPIIKNLYRKGMHLKDELGPMRRIRGLREESLIEAYRASAVGA